MSGDSRIKRTISLNLLLSLLPVVALLPVLAFALGLLGLSWQQQREQAVRDVQQVVRTLVVALDRELAASVREMERLAEFPSLNENNLGPFRDYVRRLVADQDAWDNIGLTDASGRQWLNAMAVPGQSLPAIDRPHLRAVFATGQPALSDLFADARSGSRTVAVSVPVRRDNGIRWVLTARLNPTALAKLLSEQAVRPNLVASIIDRNMLVVARSPGQDRYFGQPAASDLQAAARNTPNGAAQIVSLDGATVMAAWETLPLGWKVVVGVPQEDIDAPIRRQFAWLAAGGLAALAIALIASLLLARRLERGVGSAIDDARLLAEGRPPPPRHSRVREVDALFTALRATHQRLMTAAANEARANESVRMSEERLRLALDSVSMGTIDWQVSSNRLAWSGRTSAFFGLADDDTPTLEDALARVHPDDRATLDRAIAHARDPAGDGAFSAEFRARSRDGRLRWLQALGQMYFADAAARGQPVQQPRQPQRLIGVLRDITDAKQMELALRDADRRKDEFLAMLSHELRNPLTPIANALAILRMQATLPAGAQQALAIAERQVQQMKRLIEDLLDISRITRGKIVLHREAVDLAELARHAVESVQPLAAARGQALKLDVPTEPLRVRGDRARLTQVIENLLTNAVKFSGAGGLIELSAARDGDDVVLRVRDEGVGIPADQLAAVFEIFTQLNATIDRSQGGLGIGLALVKRLVEMHGGRVSADSRGTGSGTTFTIRLPWLADDADTGAADSAGPLTSSAASVALNGAPARRVMVVDDNTDAADTLVALLTLLGHQAQAVYGGEEAMNLAARFAPDTVLLDIGLPGISGLEVGRRLRERIGGRQLTLIAISGYGQEQDRAATAAAGFDAHLVKPVTSEDLERALGL